MRYDTPWYDTIRYDTLILIFIVAVFPQRGRHRARPDDPGGERWNENEYACNADYHHFACEWWNARPGQQYWTGSLGRGHFTNYKQTFG